jgi:hypothetical protein
MGYRTRVMGMFGAFGNMNLTSSNLLRFRQFSAKKIHPTPLKVEPISMRFQAMMIG